MNIPVEREFIGALLKGGGMLLGRRVELSWPDGAPYPQEELRRIGDQWAPHAGPEWVSADTGFCDVMVPCCRELDDSGSCDRHGLQVVQLSREAARPGLEERSNG